MSQNYLVFANRKKKMNKLFKFKRTIQQDWENLPKHEQMQQIGRNCNFKNRLMTVENSYKSTQKRLSKDVGTNSIKKPINRIDIYKRLGSPRALKKSHL